MWIFRCFFTWIYSEFTYKVFSSFHVWVCLFFFHWRALFFHCVSTSPKSLSPTEKKRASFVCLFLTLKKRILRPNVLPPFCSYYRCSGRKRIRGSSKYPETFSNILRKSFCQTRVFSFFPRITRWPHPTILWGRTSFCFLFVFLLDHLLIEKESLNKRLRKYFFVIYAVFPFFSRKPQTWISKSGSEFCLWISKFYKIFGIHVSQGSTGSDMALVWPIGLTTHGQKTLCFLYFLEKRGTKKNRIFQNKIRFLSLVSVMLRSKKKKSAFSFFFLPLSAKKTTPQQSFFVFFENVLLKDKLEKEVFSIVYHFVVSEISFSSKRK